MFENAIPPVVRESADSPCHPALLSLTTEVPEGRVLHKTVPDVYVVFWASREGEDDTESFRPNVVVQSIPMIDEEAVRRATELMVAHFAESADWDVLGDSVTPVPNHKVAVRSLSLRTQVVGPNVLQNVFMLGVMDENPALITITPSVEETASEDDKVAVRLICSQIASELLSLLP